MKNEPPLFSSTINEIGIGPLSKIENEMGKKRFVAMYFLLFAENIFTSLTLYFP